MKLMVASGRMVMGGADWRMKGIAEQNLDGVAESTMKD